jgi:hypothetical protein
LAAALPLCGSSEFALGQQGKLRIQGDSVAKLVIVNSKHQQLTFENPGKELSLRSGRYGIYEIMVYGGYRNGRYALTENDWFTVAPDTLQAAIRDVRERIVIGLFWGGALYLISLPFMVLAFRCS